MNSIASFGRLSQRLQPPVRFGEAQLFGNSHPESVRHYVDSMVARFNDISANPICSNWDDAGYMAMYQLESDQESNRMLNKLASFVQVATPEQLDAVRSGMKNLNSSLLPSEMSQKVQGIRDVLNPPSASDNDYYGNW